MYSEKTVKLTASQIKTSKGRYFLAGIYLKGSERRWVLGHRQGQEASRIFYEASSRGINASGFLKQVPFFDGRIAEAGNGRRRQENSSSCPESQ